MVWLIAFMIFINPVLLMERPSPELVVWNVGQGQWITSVDFDTCLHFDAGGEHFPAAEIYRACHSKKNILFLSHWDTDHIGYVLQLKRLAPDLCLQVGPQGHSSLKKERMLLQIPQCQVATTEVRALDVSESLVAKLLKFSRKFGRHRGRFVSSDKSASKTNDLSNVFILNQKVLIPGDSPAKMEKIWSQQIFAPLETLILSHHGSRTATSDYFLNHVHGFRLAIASCRKKKYGHPHRETLERLRAHHLPVLTTEDWGTIRMGQ